jgi:hypothetical protein
MTVHALDALFLYGNDVRKLHYTDRSVVVRMVKLCIPIKRYNMEFLMLIYIHILSY